MSDVMFNFAKFAKEFKEQPKRIVILGGSGSGKTVFGNNLTTTVVQYCRMPVLVGDPKYEKKFKGLKFVSKEWMDSDKPHKVKIQTVQYNGQIYKDAIVAEFAASLAWIKQKCVLYIEEAVQWITKDSVNFPQVHPCMYKVLQQGRERDISLIVATQRPAQLNLSFADESTDIFFFKMNPREIISIEKNYGCSDGSLNWKGKPDFSFYHKTGTEDPIYYPPIKFNKKLEEDSAENPIVN